MRASPNRLAPHQPSVLPGDRPGRRRQGGPPHALAIARAPLRSPGLHTVPPASCTPWPARAGHGPCVGGRSDARRAHGPRVVARPWGGGTGPAWRPREPGTLRAPPRRRRVLRSLAPTRAALPGAYACCAAWAAGTDPAAFEEGMRQLVAKARPVTRFGMPLPGAFALNKLRIGEVLLGGGADTRRYTEMHGDARRCTEMHRDTRRYTEIHGDALAWNG